MPIISFFTYFEDSVVESGGQNRIHLINPQFLFRPAYIPGMYSFAIAFGISSLDVYTRNIVRINFVDPEDNICLDTGDTAIGPLDVDSDLPEEMRGICVNYDFKNIALPTNGKYCTRVFVNGSLLDEFPIFIMGRN